MHTCFETVTALFNELVTVAAVIGIGRNRKHPTSILMQLSSHNAAEMSPQSNIGFEMGRCVNHGTVDISGSLINLFPSICEKSAVKSSIYYSAKFCLDIN